MERTSRGKFQQENSEKSSGTTRMGHRQESRPVTSVITEERLRLQTQATRAPREKTNKQRQAKGSYSSATGAYKRIRKKPQQESAKMHQ